MEVQGECSPAFDAVKEAFATNLAERGDIGAAVSVVRDGTMVVDLWGGYADAGSTRPWERDTIVNVWSTTKGMVAICAHRLAERGELDIDAPVAQYWPEFKAAGKETMPVRYLLSHRAGLSGLREPVTVEDLYDWDKMASLLAGMEPWWEPGTASGYHALTYGYLVGEVIRRITGLMPGQFFKREVAEPLGLDFHIGLPASEHGRVAELVMGEPPEGSDTAAIFAQMSPAVMATLTNPMMGAHVANDPAWREAEIPAANGHGTARAIATAYGKVATGELLKPETIERAREIQGPPGDLVLGIAAPDADVRIALGFWLSGQAGLFGPNPRSFGHDGYGGSFGMADPEKGLGMAWVMNSMGFTLVGDPRKQALVDAVYSCLG